MLRALASISCLALCLAAFIFGCTPMDHSHGGYDKDSEGRCTYKGEDVSKFHKHTKLEGGGEEPTNPDVCPLPPPADKEVVDKLKVGDACPDFTLKDVVSGSDVKRSTHARGHYQLIVIWASWCPACKKMQEQVLKPVYEQLASGANAQIDVLTIGVKYLGDTAEAQKAYLGANKFEWTCVHDKEGQVISDLGSKSIPTAILLDEKGVVVTYGYYLDEWARRLNKFLGEACEFKTKNPGK